MLTAKIISTQSVNSDRCSIKRMRELASFWMRGMSMSDDHQPQQQKTAAIIRQYFDDLSGLSEVDQSARLQQIREEQPEIAKDLEELISRAREDSQFLEDGVAVHVDLGSTLLPRVAPKIPGLSNIEYMTEGGQAIVFRGSQDSTNQAVAIKVLKTQFSGEESARKRHLEEIQVLAKIQHPNIVSIIDCGLTEDGREYYITRYIDGQNLDEFVTKRKLTLPQQVSLCAKIARALHAAHQSGIIHRDLKPSNIRIDRHGEPYVLDFGLAKGIDANTVEKSDSSSAGFVGSVPWASPEQIDKQFGKVTHRTDIYQLGVVFYQIFSNGKFPYDVTGEIFASFKNILQSAPAALSNSEISLEVQRLNKVLRKALKKNPDERFSSAASFAKTLEQAISISPSAKISDKKAKSSGASWTVLVICLLVASVGVIVCAKIMLPQEFERVIGWFIGTEDKKVVEEEPEPKVVQELTVPDYDKPDVDHPPFLISINQQENTEQQLETSVALSDNSSDEVAMVRVPEEPNVTENRPVTPMKAESTPSPPVQSPVLITISDSEVMEQNEGRTSLELAVELSRKSDEEVSVELTTIDGTAQSNEPSADYIAVEGEKLNFPPGEIKKTVTIEVIGDANWEADEAFTVRLDNPVNGIIKSPTATASILNDDQFESQPGALDFLNVQRGQLSEEWETVGNIGLDFNEWFPCLKVVGSGSEENAVINNSIKLGDAYFLETQLVDPGNNEVELILSSSATGDSATFIIGTKRQHDWSVSYEDSLFGNLAPSHPGDHSGVWFRIENVPEEGLFVSCNGNVQGQKRLGEATTTPFDSLKVRFIDPYQQLHLQNLRWGPVKPTPSLKTQIFGSNTRQRGGLPEGWTLIGSPAENKPRRVISDRVQLGEEFKITFQINVKRRGELTLTLLGEGGGPSVPVHFSFLRSEATIGILWSE